MDLPKIIKKDGLITPSDYKNLKGRDYSLPLWGYMGKDYLFDYLFFLFVITFTLYFSIKIFLYVMGF